MVEEYKQTYRTNSTDLITHLDLSGGKYNIPKDKLSKFYKKYAKECFLSNIKVTQYLCEVRKSIFRMFFDIDISLGNAKVNIDYRAIVKEFNRILQTIFKEVDLTSIICSTAGKIKGNNNFVALHIHYPNVYVNSDIMINLVIPHILSNISLTLPDNVLSTWAQIIDKSPYDSAKAFRLVGSDKWITCKLCKNGITKRKSCSNCDRNGGFSENRIYKPIDILTKDGEVHQRYNSFLTPNDDEDVRKVNLLFVFRMTLITPFSLHNWNFVEELSPLQMELPSSSSSSSRIIEKKKPRERQFVKKLPSKFDVLFKHLKEFLMSLSDKYDNISIIDIKEHANGNNFIIITNSRYCLNIRDFHNSNRIYFLITPKGLSQRCHCTCENQHRSIYNLKCADFKNNNYVMPNKLYKYFYKKGKAKKKNNYDNYFTVNQLNKLDDNEIIFKLSQISNTNEYNVLKNIEDDDFHEYRNKRQRYS